MSTIFNVHPLTPQQQKQAASYTQSIKSVSISQWLSIAVYGEKQSGKTTCALDLGQCPFTELPPSPVSSVLQTFIKTKTDQILGLQIHDSNQFVKSHSVIFIVNACKPESVNFLNKYVQQLTEDQLVFIFVNKCDIATKQEFIQANNKALELLQRIKKTNKAQMVPGMLKDNFSLPQLLNVITLSMHNMRFQNAKKEMARTQAEYTKSFDNNEKVFLDRLNGSLEKRGFPTVVSFEIPEEPIQSEQQKIDPKVEQTPQKVNEQKLNNNIESLQKAESKQEQIVEENIKFEPDLKKETQTKENEQKTEVSPDETVPEQKEVVTEYNQKEIQKEQQIKEEVDEKREEQTKEIELKQTETVKDQSQKDLIRTFYNQDTEDNQK
ncbi:Conserved_hypothetical protein [Hexamita inflata]|uniref:Uncharacterized protein n=1 Tax=Hexamita inflata TaxID=28002 RepID=A0AA86PIW4_9EUKA|nr:Conserved hypothetical protein [Hexamita inflata]CAI9952489.1 Conserved hypothetical protein [Hexamita inflata]